MSLTPAPRKGKRFLTSVKEPLRTLIVAPAVWLGLGLTIGLLFLSDHLGQRLSFEQSFNGILSVFLILVFMPICHAGCHRWFWHIEQGRRAGLYRQGEKVPDMWTEETEPAPPLNTTPHGKLVYALLYVAAMALLFFIYLPLGHQQVIHGFIASNSSGRASASSLAGIVIIWLPLMAGLFAVFFFMERDMKKNPRPSGDGRGETKDRTEAELVGGLCDRRHHDQLPMLLLGLDDPAISRLICAP